MITNIRAFQEVLKRNNLPTPDTYLGISELIRSLYRPDVSPNPERIREVLEELTWPVTVPAGNPITFKSCSEVLASEALVTFAPKQSGTGDPSPTNIRPISGLDSLHLYQDTEQTETPETTHTVTFSDTVYGGSYDFVSGGGTANLSDKVDLGSLTWSYDSNGQRFYSTVLTDMKNTEGWNNLIFYSENYKRGEPKYDGTGGDNIIGLGNQRIYIRNTQYTDAASFKTAMSGYYVCYELATPTEITLTPEDIELLKGSNTIWTDGDNVTVKFQILK